MLKETIVFVLLLLTSVERRVNCSRYLEWNNDTPLKYEDFKGVRNSDSLYAATMSGIGYRTEIKGDSLWLIFNAKFDRDSSWMTIKAESLLKHEQLHFDITELSLRYFYLKSRNLKLYRSRIQIQLDSVYNASDNINNSLQSKYDDDTDHGTDSAQQQKWQNYIEEELKKNSISKDKKLLIILKD